MSVILIDSSFNSFYRFFATLKWMSMANKEIYQKFKDDCNYDWSQNKLFLEKYEKMYLESIKKLVKNKVFNNSKIIFCLDAPQNTLWRNKLSNCYKGNRIDLSKKNNFKPTFKYTYETLIPKLVKNNKNIFMIKFNELEADDIIALCSRYIRKKHKNKEVYLVSGDKDFYQLGYEKLYFVDFKKKILFSFSKKEATENLYQKIINGDCSDNIPSIFPKNKKELSNKERKEIRESKIKLKKYLENNKSVYDQFKLNQKLIDFKNIPKKYHLPIYRKIKKYLQDI